MPKLDMDAGKALLAKVHQENDKASAKSLNEYLQRVLIDVPPKPKRFGDVIEWWQVERNNAMVPAFEFVAGINPTYSGPKKFWLGLSKGQDKSSYLGRMLNWVLAYAKRPLRCYCGAKDADQSQIIKDCMYKEAEFNKPWLRQRLDFKGRSVEGTQTGSRVDFLTSDGRGEHGKNPDLIVLDEITHWDDDGLFTALWSAIPKRQGFCVAAILTNAGLLGSWQRTLRDLAEQKHGQDWYFYEQPYGKQLASWMTEEKIAEEARLLSTLEADRLYRNRWLDPSETGAKLFSPSDVDRNLGAPLPPPAGSHVFLGVDFGGVRDRTALTVLWLETQTGVIHVVSQTVWQGSPENEVRVKDVALWLETQFAIYPNATAVIDVLGQMLQTSQEMEDAGHDVIRFEYRAGKSNAMMLDTLRSLLTNQKLRFTLDCGMLGGSTLASELKEVVGKQMSYGERIDHKTSKHDDRVVSLGMACLAAIKNTEPGPVPQKMVPTDPITPVLYRQTNSLDRGHAARRQLFGIGMPHS